MKLSPCFVFVVGLSLIHVLHGVEERSDQVKTIAAIAKPEGKVTIDANRPVVQLDLLSAATAPAYF